MPRFLTVAQAAKLLSVTTDRITDWIATGELTAVNIGATGAAKRPTWRISEAELQRFLDSRQSSPAPKIVTRRHRAVEQVPHYFR